jgi:Gpi18-like mannosyltransferase
MKYFFKNDSVNKKMICITLIIIGLLAKYVLLDIKTGDYIAYLEPWMNFIKTHGYEHSLKFGFYDYTPSYIYILIAIVKLGFNPLFSVKIVSIFFEYVLAFFIGKIATIKYKSNLVLWIAISVIPILPSILFNSSYLSQSDSIYSTFVVGSVYFLLTRKQLVSVLFLGFAFAFKMQTAIILPFVFVMMLRGNIKWYYFLIIPIVYIISILPVWLYGRPLNELLIIYLSQSGSYKYLTLNFPNLYILISNVYYEPVKIAGIIFTALFTLLSGFWLIKKSFDFTFELWIKLAFLSAIVVPFLLPGMHERYMYLGDVLGVLYFLVNRKKIHLPIGILIVSFYSYIRCSRYNEILPMWPAFIIYSLVIIFTTTDFIATLKKSYNEITK